MFEHKIYEKQDAFVTAEVVSSVHRIALDWNRPPRVKFLTDVPREEEIESRYQVTDFILRVLGEQRTEDDQTTEALIRFWLTKCRGPEQGNPTRMTKKEKTQRTQSARVISMCSTQRIANSDMIYRIAICETLIAIQISK
ncbi:hypothetical protein NDU88_010399 [Pleurodeles waltl]|uniref:Uncharacterized protein n=1 Tax=Pleurodeles waltl TaxID=8319 RepID=A0AAV7S2J8_PLEWA|nr:hypothetical protein NDU88_010399 [Pleurodeles waltl]